MADWQKNGISRRQFMGAAAGVAAFTFVPKRVFGANEKLNIAGIGVGGRGGSVLRGVDSQNIVALCDVDWRRASGSFNRYPKARKYKDFRQMLDKEDKKIDAVTVATPDNLHAIAAVTAMKLGKHVYCEKPLAHDVSEARKMGQVARKYKVATQMGNQGQASEETRLMCEYIWDGAIGPIREVHVWTDRPLRGHNDVYWPQGVKRPTEKPPVPDGLDWDLWLGPAPYRPYHPDYLPFKWRGWWDFGTGALGDIGCHRIDPIFRALKLGHPSSVEASCSLVNNETYPVASVVNYQFPARGDMPPVKLSWYDGGVKPRRPDELEQDRQLGTNGILFVGDKGKMLEERIIPESRMKEYDRPEKTIPRSPGHFVEWIEACKGGKPAGSNFDHAAVLAQVVLLGNVVLRPELKETVNRQKLIWDSEKMAFTNVPEANKYLKREYRKGWSL